MNRVRIKLLLLICILGYSGSAKAGGSYNPELQHDRIELIISKFQESIYVESVEISPLLLRKLSEAESTRNLLKDMTGIRIMVFKKYDRKRGEVCSAFSEELKQALKQGYSKLMSAKSDGESVNIYLEDKSSQVIMLIDNSNEFTLMTIDGCITEGVIKSVMSGEIRLK